MSKLFRNPIRFLSLSLIIYGCSFTVPEQQKVNGISLEGSSSPIEEYIYDEFKTINANWVCLMPYAYMEHDEPDISFKNLKWQWWGEGRDGIKRCTDKAHDQNIKVMIKPHLWIGRGHFTGDLDMTDESNWPDFVRNYEEYIMTYARLADSLDVELFCIGTEMENFVLERTAFWENLISKVRSVYGGKLTYAANWNEYTKVPFWASLDYLGIDAYFPLSEIKNPSVQDLNNGWAKWKKEIEGVYTQNNKPVLFTEYGYRSIEGATIEPWSSGREGALSNNEQSTAYESLYQSCWNEKWMAGGFLWKWHAPQHNPIKKTMKFTPQFKPTLEVIKKWYSYSTEK